MQEKQVTIGENTFKLEEPFLVLATQNPIEQEGTYHLPEAQVDRFMLKLNITYPNKEEEHKILKSMAVTDKKIEVSAVVKAEDILKARKVVNEVYMDEKIEKYIVDITFATREPASFGINDLDGLIEYEKIEEYQCSCNRKIIDCPFWLSVSHMMKQKGYEFDIARFGNKFATSSGTLVGRLRTGSFRNTTKQ